MFIDDNVVVLAGDRTSRCFVYRFPLRGQTVSCLDLASRSGHHTFIICPSNTIGKGFRRRRGITKRIGRYIKSRIDGKAWYDGRVGCGIWGEGREMKEDRVFVSKFPKGQSHGAKSCCLDIELYFLRLDFANLVLVNNDNMLLFPIK